jgi:hypothetical protein
LLLIILVAKTNLRFWYFNYGKYLHWLVRELSDFILVKRKGAGIHA